MKRIMYTIFLISIPGYFFIIFKCISMLILLAFFQVPLVFIAIHKFYNEYDYNVRYIYKKNFKRYFKINNLKYKDINIYDDNFLKNLVDIITCKYRNMDKKDLYYEKKELIYTLDTFYKVDISFVFAIFISCLVTFIGCCLKKNLVNFSFYIGTFYFIGILVVYLAYTKFETHVDESFVKFCIDILNDSYDISKNEKEGSWKLTKILYKYLSQNLRH